MYITHTYTCRVFDIHEFTKKIYYAQNNFYYKKNMQNPCYVCGIKQLLACIEINNFNVMTDLRAYYMSKFAKILKFKNCKALSQLLNGAIK